MVNIWSTRRIVTFAHSGGELEAPGSTLFAMDSATRAGASGLEMDLHPTVDRELVVIHDETLDRTTNGSGYVREHGYAELQDLDAAYHFRAGQSLQDDQDEEYPYRGLASSNPLFRITRIEEVFDRYPDAIINLDIKEDLGPSSFIEERVAELIDHYGRKELTIVASFHQAVLDRVREIDSGISTSASPVEALEFYESALARTPIGTMAYRALQLPLTYGGIEYLDSNFVDFVHEAELALHVWTVNEEPAMERLIRIGVDGIITDLPTLCVDVLRQAGMSWPS